MPLARSIAKRWKHIEDVEQAALIGLHLADVVAPPDMPANEFRWFAIVRIRREAIEHLRRVAHGGRYQGDAAKKPHHPEPESVAMAQSQGLLPEGIHPYALIARELDPEAQAIANEMARERQAVLGRIGDLPARTQLIMRRRLAGDAPKHIAADLGISQVRVSQITNESVAKLRDKP